MLALNVNKIKKTFNISQTLTLNQTIKYISEWYEEYFKNKKNVKYITINQIKKFSKLSKLKI